jgi:hypothetical protein
LAERNLKRFFPRGLPVTRQIVLAIAIILLLYVEIMFGVIVFAPEAPVIHVILAGWLAYFALIAIATFPPRQFWVTRDPFADQDR